MEKQVFITEVSLIEMVDNQQENQQRFVEITTDTGLKGYAGPLDGEYQFHAVYDRLHIFHNHLVNQDIFDTNLNFEHLWNRIYPDHPLRVYESGKDPLTGEEVWQKHRTARHTPTGEVITAFSAIDIALWDLRGKASKQPVYQLLDGTRTKLPVYISCMGSMTKEEALGKGTYWYEKGFKRHKCFLPHRPMRPEGIKDNLEMAAAVRNGLPEDAEIMFDLSRLSDQVDDLPTRTERLKWASDMVKGLEQYHPYWVEEPVSPDDIAGYEAIRKTNPTVKISGGEHLYTRWNLKPFLDRGLLDFVQCDPEWCGGISEFIEICKMVKRSYPNVRVIPHGHMFLAAPQGVAAQSEKLAPMAEYLYQVIPDRTRYLKSPLEPAAGVFTIPGYPGVGPDLDTTKYQIVNAYKGREL